MKRYVELILSANRVGNAVDDRTADWLASCDAEMLDKLAIAGLIDAPAEKPAAATLAQFITRYVASRTDVKPATKEVWRQGELGLSNHFGAARELSAITPGDADGYKLALVAEGLASLTIRKRLQFAKTIFRAAVRHKLIADNPFADVTIKTGMPDRGHFISHADTAALLKACETLAKSQLDWQLMIGLARYGGLRCPSEVLSLRWRDIDWATERINVQSPKTEHHPGKDCRKIPLFPELKELLETAKKAAPKGAVYIVDERFRRSSNGLVLCHFRCDGW